MRHREVEQPALGLLATKLTSTLYDKVSLTFDTH